jgi:hypothetical protein
MKVSAVLDGRCGSMKRSKFSEGQIVYAIHLAKFGTPIGDPYRHYGMAEQPFLSLCSCGR